MSSLVHIDDVMLGAFSDELTKIALFGLFESKKPTSTAPTAPTAGPGLPGGAITEGFAKKVNRPLIARPGRVVEKGGETFAKITGQGLMKIPKRLPFRRL